MKLTKRGEDDYIVEMDNAKVVYTGTVCRIAQIIISTHKLTSWEDWALAMRPLLKGQAKSSYFGIYGSYIYSE